MKAIGLGHLANIQAVLVAMEEMGHAVGRGKLYPAQIPIVVDGPAVGKGHPPKTPAAIDA